MPTTVTLGEALGVSQEKAKGLGFPEIATLFASASPAIIALINAQLPGFAAAVTTVNNAISAYNALVGLTAAAQNTFDIAQAVVLPAATPMLAAKVNQAAGAAVLESAKNTVKTTVLTSTIVIP